MLILRKGSKAKHTAPDLKLSQFEPLAWVALFLFYMMQNIFKIAPLLRVTNFPLGIEKRTIIARTRGESVPGLQEVMSAAQRSCREQTGGY